MSDEPTRDDEFGDAFFERFGETQLGGGLDPEQVDLDRLHELIAIAVAAHRQRDLLVEMMNFPSRFHHRRLFS